MIRRLSGGGELGKRGKQTGKKWKAVLKSCAFVILKTEKLRVSK